MSAQSSLAVVEFENYPKSVRAVLDDIGAAEILARQQRIILKPNVVNDSPPPVTTDVHCVEAIVDYCREHTKAEIVIAEGCGGCDTFEGHIRLANGLLGVVTGR